MILHGNGFSTYENITELSSDLRRSRFDNVRLGDGYMIADNREEISDKLWIEASGNRIGVSSHSDGALYIFQKALGLWSVAEATPVALVSENDGGDLIVEGYSKVPDMVTVEGYSNVPDMSSAFEPVEFDGEEG